MYDVVKCEYVKGSSMCQVLVYEMPNGWSASICCMMLSSCWGSDVEYRKRFPTKEDALSAGIAKQVESLNDCLSRKLPKTEIDIINYFIGCLKGELLPKQAALFKN